MFRIALFYILYCAVALIELIKMAMLVRAVMSWFSGARASAFWRLLYTITEVPIAPFRALLSRSAFVQRFPFDLSFMVTFIALTVIQRLLL